MTSYIRYESPEINIIIIAQGIFYVDYDAKIRSRLSMTIFEKLKFSHGKILPKVTPSPELKTPEPVVQQQSNRKARIPAKKCNRARAREISRLITLDQSSETTFKLVGEGKWSNRF